MTEKQKFLDSITLQGTGEIASSVSIIDTIRQQHRAVLEKVQKECSHVSVGYAKDESRKAGARIRDQWGCLWIYPLDYMDGQVIEHPLKDWSTLKSYKVPDPATFTNWEQAAKDMESCRKQGKLAMCGTEHGFFFLKLTYLRGFENAMMDIAEHNTHLPELIAMIENYWMEIVKRWVDMKVDAISFGDDLGLQTSLPVSPAAWRTYIEPSFKRIFSYCREHNVHVWLHTDGYILDIIPDLIECGVSVLNPQDRVNGIENIRQLAWGKIAIDLDIDRQHLTFRGTPAEIDAHILDCVKTLGSPTGGLWMKFGAYPGTPIENIAAVIRAMEKYRDFWVRK